MKKNLLLITLFIFTLIFSQVISVHAENVALVVKLANGTSHEECINVPKNTSGYDILQDSHLSLIWSNPGLYGHALCKINGYGDEVSGSNCAWGNEYWSFRIYDDGWKLLPVGFDAGKTCWNRRYGSWSGWSGHYCGQDKDIIGLARVSFDKNSEFYNNKPPVIDFNDVCGFQIKQVDASIDGYDEKNIQEGETLKRSAKPERSIDFNVKFSNFFPVYSDITLKDAFVKVTIERVNDGEDIKTESDYFTLRPETTKKVKLHLDIPLIVAGGNYKVLVEIKARGSNRVNYKDDKEFTLNIKKDTHAVKFVRFDISPETIDCSRTTEAGIKMINVGRRDEDISFKVRNELLGTLAQKDVMLPSGSNDDSVYSNSFILDLTGAKPGNYTLDATLSYNNGDVRVSKVVKVIIEPCSGRAEAGQGVKAQKQAENNLNNKTTTQGLLIKQTGQQSSSYVPAEGYVSNDGDNKTVAIVVALVLLTLFIGIILSVFIIKRYY